jgi:putative flippase GtrA
MLKYSKNTDKAIKQIVKFVIVGIPVVSVDFLTYYVFVSFLPHYIARTIAYIFGSTTSYILNKLYTFEQKQKSFNEMIRFYALYFFTLLATVVVNGFLLSVLFPGKIILAYSLSTLMGIILNFIGQKFFVFRSKNKYEI